MNKNMLIKIGLPLLTVLQCLFIYSMSAAPAHISQDMSGSITYRGADVLLNNIDSLDMAARLAVIKEIDHFIRKTAHFTEYAVLGGLLLADMRLVFCRWEAIFTFLAWVIGTVYAVTDEWHQTFVEGRSGKPADVLLDSMGVAFGILLVSILFRFFFRLGEGMREGRAGHGER